jgi:hypothetical protein
LDERPTLEVVAIQGSLVLCQCNFCRNTFTTYGQWIFEDLDPDKDARELEIETVLEEIFADLGFDIRSVSFSWNPKRRCNDPW